MAPSRVMNTDATFQVSRDRSPAAPDTGTETDSPPAREIVPAAFESANVASWQLVFSTHTRYPPFNQSPSSRSPSGRSVTVSEPKATASPEANAQQPPPSRARHGFPTHTSPPSSTSGVSTCRSRFAGPEDHESVMTTERRSDGPS